ncbi:acyltransferase family protein [Sphingoaurantiacus capsulatus]|uniref:Acyltransferase family protein n=1 Tax=Sphingoaurantiacus capsulatus TaxID=1771310 RepID=A0ABV7XDL3_9SPHN
MSDVPKLLASLQVGRAIAAVAVLLCHAEQFTRQFTEVPPWLHLPLSYGYLGVDFFFALSGFIIYFANHDEAGHAGWAARYSGSRLTRIFAPYLPIGVMLGVAYTLQPQLAAGYDWNWFSTLTLLPSGGSPSLGVAWTLQHEILFYAIMLVLIAARRVLIGCLIWLGAIGIAEVAGTPVIGLSLIDVEFIGGIAAAWLFIRRPRGSVWPSAMLGAGLCLAGGFLGFPEARVLLGLGLASLILATARLEVAGGWRVPQGVLLLGEASYAIYLVHVPVLRFAARVAGPALTWELLLPLLIAIGVLAGLAYHLGFERPALRQVRRLLRREPAAAAPRN